MNLIFPWFYMIIVIFCCIKEGKTFEVPRLGIDPLKFLEKLNFRDE